MVCIVMDEVDECIQSFADDNVREMLTKGRTYIGACLCGVGLPLCGDAGDDAGMDMREAGGGVLWVKRSIRLRCTALGCLNFVE